MKYPEKNLIHFGQTIEIKRGWLGIVFSERGLARVCLPQRTQGEARKALELGRRRLDALNFDAPPAKARPYLDSLAGYFEGRVKDFSLPLDLEGATNFEMAVWKTAREIPYGETRSYGWIASNMRRPGSERAVGGALGRNPLPIIIPCHRIVRADGSLGGFSAGIEWKRRLLDLEQKFNRRRHV